MKTDIRQIVLGVVLCAAVPAFAKLYGDLPDAQHAWAVHDWVRPKPHRVAPAAKCGGAPSDAVVLFDGTRESFERNWCDKNGKPSLWKLGNEGDFYCVPNWKNGGDIFTRGEFGDCQLHLEYRHESDVTDGGRGPQMRGNSGVFLMGNYEIQVLESYHTSQEDCSVDNYTDGQAGAVYAENPPMVNPQRRPGEWQTYDIVFHQPVWEGEKLVHPGSVTVFFNGVLVQDHWEMEGLTTHCKRRPLAPHAAKGPLKFQDHGCIVHFRNIWIREIPSRWANTTHSTMSAKADDVMKLRRETASKLYAQIADRDAVAAANVQALGEVIGYAREGEWEQQWKKIARAYAEKLGAMDEGARAAAKDEIESVRKAMGVLVRGKVVDPAKCVLCKQLGVK